MSRSYLLKCRVNLPLWNLQFTRRRGAVFESRDRIRASRRMNVIHTQNSSATPIPSSVFSISNSAPGATIRIADLDDCEEIGRAEARRGQQRSKEC